LTSKNTKALTPEQELEIKYVSVDALIPYASNARTHSDESVALIAGSIREFGFLNPVLTDGDKGILCGHGRIMAARKLGLDKVPTLDASHLTKNQRKAYILADNQLATRSGWDKEMLSLEMGDLKDEGFDLSLIGFDDTELANMFVDKTEGLTDPDAVPDIPDDPVTKLGDVWLLGRHRLCCGDSTDADAVSALLGDVKPHLMVTDPPYGVEYDPAKSRGVSANSAKGVVLNDDNADWREAWALFPGEIAYVWHAGLRAREVVESLEACDFTMRAQIIWDKTQLVMSRGHYHFQHEPCWYAVKKGGTAHWSGDRKQSTVWAIPHRRNDTGHGTQKPVECMKRPIENNSSPGQAVYEPFSGSGTTVIAGEMTGRAIYAMELSPAYVDMCICRWQNFTGEQAKLESTGEFFPIPEAKSDAT